MSFEDLPEEWEVAKLGDEKIAELVMGQSPPSSTYNKNGEGIPFFQGNAEFRDTYPTPTLSCSQPIKIAEKNDILLSVRAPVGEININPSKSCIGRGLAAIRSKKHKLDYLYLFYVLKFEGKRFHALSMGSTFKAVRKTEVERFKIPLPPLPEQQKIASVLSTVDNAIQKVNDAIARTERLKQGLMQRLLNNKRWPIKTVREVLEIESGIKELQARGYLDRGEFPVIDQGQEFIAGYSNDKSKLFDRKIPVIVYGDHTKIIKYIDFPFVIGASGAKILSTINVKENDTKFLYYALQSVRVPEKSGGYARHSRELLLQKFRIPTSVQEQQKISSILSIVDKKIDLEHQRKEKLNRVKKGLMDDLLTGRKRMKVEAGGG